MALHTNHPAGPPYILKVGARAAACRLWSGCFLDTAGQGSAPAGRTSGRLYFVTAAQTRSKTYSSNGCSGRVLGPLQTYSLLGQQVKVSAGARCKDRRRKCSLLNTYSPPVSHDSSSGVISSAAARRSLFLQGALQGARRSRRFQGLRAQQAYGRANLPCRIAASQHR